MGGKECFSVWHCNAGKQRRFGRFCTLQGCALVKAVVSAAWRCTIKELGTYGFSPFLAQCRTSQSKIFLLSSHLLGCWKMQKKSRGGEEVRGWKKAGCPQGTRNPLLLLSGSSQWTVTMVFRSCDNGVFFCCMDRGGHNFGPFLAFPSCNAV